MARLFQFAAIVLTAAHAAAAASSGQSTRVIASTAGAALNSNLLKGGGSDDTRALQDVLDRAQNGKTIHLIVDGPALIAGLNIHSGTTIECTREGGFYLANDSDRAMLRNANRSRGAILDRDISIKGCLFNGNRHGQRGQSGPFQSQQSEHMYYRTTKQEADGTFKSALQFFGVERLSIENVKVINATAFGIWIANARRSRVIAVSIDALFPTVPKEGSIEQKSDFIKSATGQDDGLHFNGPIHHLTIDNVKLRTIDDGIALNANDMGVDDMTLLDDMGPYVGQGPITNVDISNVRFVDGFLGIRMLSTDQAIDNISIVRISGELRSRAFIISHHIDRKRTGLKGNFGSISFRDIDIAPVSYVPPYGLWWCSMPMELDVGEECEFPLFSINGHIEKLHVLQASVTAVDERPVIRIGKDASVQQMCLDIRVHDPKNMAVPLRLAGGTVKRMMIHCNGSNHND